MKQRERLWIATLRQRFVLTAAEWRIIIFIVAAFALGLAAKHYRAIHRESVSKIDNERLVSETRDKPGPTQSRKTRQLRKKKVSATPETSSGATEPRDD